MMRSISIFGVPIVRRSETTVLRAEKAVLGPYPAVLRKDGTVVIPTGRSATDALFKYANPEIPAGLFDALAALGCLKPEVVKRHGELKKATAQTRRGCNDVSYVRDELADIGLKLTAAQKRQLEKKSQELAEAKKALRLFYREALGYHVGSAP